MRKLVYILLTGALIACDTEGAWNCVQKTGDIEQFEFFFADTIKVLEVYDDFSVRFYPSSEQRVVVETGKNLIGEVQLKMADDSTLVVKNNNNCNWTRRPHNMTLHFYTNQLAYFEKVNFGEVTSEGQLQLEKLEVTTLASGNVQLDVACERSLFMKVFSLSNVTLSGMTPRLILGIDPKIDGRFDSRQLETPMVSFWHSGTNDMMIRATESVTGTIRSYGDVLLYGNPVKVDIENLGLGGELIHKE